MDTTCRGITRKGTACKNKPRENGYCRVHAFLAVDSLDTVVSTPSFQFPGMIRVGTCLFNNGNRQDPHVDGFTTIVVLTKHASEWYPLGPYNLKDDKGRIFENIYQGSKCYLRVPKVTSKYAAASPIIAWEWPEEEHAGMIDGKLILYDQYFHWRDTLQNHSIAVRTPVGWKYRHTCVGAFKDGDFDHVLDYVEARKQIYLPLYSSLVRQQPQFQELVDRYKSGENLLIAEQDGPHQESLLHYKAKYEVQDDFITDLTMLATKDHLNIMLHDTKHPFGHGYCLAAAIQDMLL